jgi:hypothetical protein
MVLNRSYNKSSETPLWGEVILVARWIGLWRVNLAVPWPMDPAQALELNEKMWAVMDGLIKKGEFEEFGFFPDGYTGYAIGKGEAMDVYRNSNMFLPFVCCEVHEIIPYEKGKEIMRAMLKGQIAATKKK